MIKLLMVLCLFVVSSVPAIAAVTREPYLQMVTPTSMTIVWQTDLNSPNDSRVQYGTAFGILNQTALGSATISPSNSGVKNHIVTIAGLSSSAKYFYNVGTVTNNEIQGGGTTNHFFLTAPTVGSAVPFRTWVLGDSGNASSNQIAVRDAMLNKTPSPDIILHMGDIAYDDGTDTEFTTNHFSIYENILCHTPLWPTLGNHEANSSSSATGLGPYYEAHVLPASGQAGGVSSGTEAYYSFDYANAHFIVLDSMDSNRMTNGPMLTWLQADLAATSQEWVIAFWHHPPYTKGTHDSDDVSDSAGRLIDVRENVLPILEAGGVDLVLGGHSHIYERSYLIDQAYGLGSSPNFATPSFGTLQTQGKILDAGDGRPSGNGAYEKQIGGASNAGAVYVVSGHGGKSVCTTNCGNHPVMFFDESQFGSVLLDINGPALTVQNVRSSGAITDTFSLNKVWEGEIIWRQTSGAIAIWLMDGSTILSQGSPGSVSTDWTIVGVNDMDGDDKTDLVWRHTSGAVVVWLMDGSTILSQGSPGSVSTDWTIEDVADMDGDGKADLVWRQTSGAVVVWLMDGATVLSQGSPGGVSTDWTIEDVADMDGDGKADLVWRQTSGTVVVWLMDGSTILSQGSPGSVSTDWTIVHVNDMDGDGRADLVWRQTSGTVVVWLMDGATVISQGSPGTVSTDWTIEDVADMDGDGKADLVWRQTSGTVVVWLMDGATVISQGSPGVVSIDWTVQPERDN